MSDSIGERLKAWKKWVKTFDPDDQRNIRALLSDAERMHAALREWGEAHGALVEIDNEERTSNTREWIHRRDDALNRWGLAKRALESLALEIAGEKT